MTLLGQLKEAGPGSPVWQILHDLYLPLIRKWLKRVPGLGDEADDLAQEVLLIVSFGLSAFERRREGSFRAWLRAITANRARSYSRQRRRRQFFGRDRADQFLDQMADPASDLARQWDRDHDEQVARQLLGAVRPDFTPTVWEAFRQFALDGRPAGQVAGELGMTENAVLCAKQRVLRRLREEAKDRPNSED